VNDPAAVREAVELAYAGLDGRVDLLEVCARIEPLCSRLAGVRPAILDTFIAVGSELHGQPVVGNVRTLWSEEALAHREPGLVRYRAVVEHQVRTALAALVAVLDPRDGLAEPPVAISTARLLLDRCLQHKCGEEAVTWAQAALEEGWDSPHLRMLAGADPPFRHFELSRLRDLALDELGVGDVPLSTAVGMVAAELLRPFVAGEVGGSALQAVADLHSEAAVAGWVEELWPLYVLSHEWQDFLAVGGPHAATGQSLDSFYDEARREAAAFCERVRGVTPLALQRSHTDRLRGSDH
jgi:hypothetical protein